MCECDFVTRFVWHLTVQCSSVDEIFHFQIWLFPVQSSKFLAFSLHVCVCACLRMHLKCSYYPKSSYFFNLVSFYRWTHAKLPIPSNCVPVLMPWKIHNNHALKLNSFKFPSWCINCLALFCHLIRFNVAVAVTALTVSIHNVSKQNESTHTGDKTATA